MAKLVWRGEFFINKVRNTTFTTALRVAETVKNEIQGSFTVHGDYREYRRKGGRVHWSSRPGQPPAIDTGRLYDSISVNWSNSPRKHGIVGPNALLTDGVVRPRTKDTIVVGTNIPNYPDYLETGTSKMEARQFLRPIRNGFRRMGTDIVGRVKAEFSKPRDESGRFVSYSKEV